MAFKQIERGSSLHHPWPKVRIIIVAPPRRHVVGMSAPLNLVRALLLLAAVAAHGPDVMGKADDWLAIDFSTAGGLKPVTFKDTYVCIKLMLRPEDGGSAKEKWEVTARVQFLTTLPDKIKKAEILRGCWRQHGEPRQITGLY